ncbi:uncharacterized protein K460DRAFT_188603 [Cucurbitaria berberidis CBS 394.84]|uniref:Uncharacterized protein n=1 Tax=Cucurbitaria berberidis CBS 394.84 TaxID=1168544 RepID=A0A9P4GB61_9PLEO|nr:uncharacterized protein K460DRAFT_188603 [Cucurbitaria berberidis CBS 394.84]KAF1842583.1 hypothetical protein K460DRAFT_188603 [Cucurbitaria berberidis CBS 394.84]
MDFYPGYFVVTPLLAVLSEEAAAANYTTCANGVRSFSPTDQFICDACRALKFSDRVLEQPVGAVTLIIDRKPSRFESMETMRCVLCLVLCQIIENFHPDVHWVPTAMTSPRLLEILWRSWAPAASTEGERPYVIISSRSDKGGFKPQRVPERYDHRRAKLWIANCIESHVQCSDERFIIDGMRLIDCQTMKIVNATPGAWKLQ